MPLVYMIVWIALIGLIVWLITTYIQMPAQFRTVIIVVAVVCVILWVASVILPGIAVGPMVGRPRLGP